MIRFSQVSLIRGTKPLLEGADVTLNPGEHIGLVGANGSGKSSLFALLRGELHTDKGELDYPAQWRVAHVAQEALALDRPAVEYAIDGDGALRSLEAKLAAAEAEGPAFPGAGSLPFVTNMAFAPDGRLFFTEKETGEIRIVQDGRLLLDLRTVFERQEDELLAAVRAAVL